MCWRTLWIRTQCSHIEKTIAVDKKCPYVKQRPKKQLCNAADWVEWRLKLPGKCIDCMVAEGDERIRRDGEERRRKEADNAMKMPDWMDGARHIGQPNAGLRGEAGYGEALVWSARDEHIVPIP
jgi:hypothetical protein